VNFKHEWITMIDITVTIFQINPSQNYSSSSADLTGKSGPSQALYLIPIITRMVKPSTKDIE
jgi:hypothetical protein